VSKETEPLPSPGQEPDGRHGPHVFVADLHDLTISHDDRHHFERVLRLRVGDELTACDGAGSWQACRFGPALEPTGPIRFVPPPFPPIAIAFALVKGGRPELVVQKLTELGVDEIIPFSAGRSVVQWDDDKARRQGERFQRVAREASMQSRRCYLPVVLDPETFASVATRTGATLAERHGALPTLSQSSLVVMVGPEGGWTDEERRAVPRQFGFGSHVLRAETASIAAATILGAIRSGVVSNA